MKPRSIVFGLIAAAVLLGVSVTGTALNLPQFSPHAGIPPKNLAREGESSRPSSAQPTTVQPPSPASTGIPAVPPMPVPPLVETANPILHAFADKTASERLPVDFPARLPGVDDPNDIQWVLHVLNDPTDLDSIRNEAANLLRRSQVPRLEDHLFRILANRVERERFRSYAVQHLGDMMKEYREGTGESHVSQAAAIRSRLTMALTDPQFMVRSEALLALSRERDPHAIAIIRKGLNDPQWSQAQDLLIRCAKEANVIDLIPAIRPLVYAENQVVRIAAINVLAQWKDEASRSAFEEAGRSAIQRVQRAGALAVRLLDDAGQ